MSTVITSYSIHYTKLYELLDRGWPGPVVRFFHYQNPLLLALFVALDWTRARLGLETSNQRVIARRRED